MASSTPTSADSESQIMSDVDFSEWLTEDCSTLGSPDSDFDELFSQITYTAASGGSDWHAVDWLSFDDLLKPAFGKVEIIKLHQEPAEAILPELAPEACSKEPGEAIAAEIISELAEAASPELASQLAPQEPTEATVPEVIPEPAVSEKPHNTENLVNLQRKSLPIKTRPRKEYSAKPLVIDLTGPEPANSEIPISQPKDTSNDVDDVRQGCRASISKNDDETLMDRVNGQDLSPRAVPLSTERKRKRPTSASSSSSRRTRKKTTVQEYVGSDRLFTSTALKEIDDLMEAQLRHFKAASKDFAASEHFEETMLRLTTLRTLIVNHGALEEEVTEEWEHSR